MPKPLGFMLFGIFLAALTWAFTLPCKKYTVTGIITQTSVYCGGARPSEEVMDTHRKPKPYPGKTLFLRKGKSNDLKKKIVASFTADEKGEFTVNVEPGTYAVIQDLQCKPLDWNEFKSSKMVAVDSACVSAWWKAPLAVIEVSKKGLSGLNYNFHHPCFVSGDVPCMRYTGPPPQ